MGYQTLRKRPDLPAEALRISRDRGMDAYSLANQGLHTLEQSLKWTQRSGNDSIFFSAKNDLGGWVGNSEVPTRSPYGCTDFYALVESNGPEL
jgi:hypothetical protein